MNRIAIYTEDQHVEEPACLEGAILQAAADHSKREAPPGQGRPSQEAAPLPQADRPPLTTLADAWAEFAAKAIPPGSPPEQYQEMRRAFYCGAWTAVGTFDAVTDPEADIEEVDAVHVLNSLEGEILAFKDGCLNGSA